MRNDYLEHCNKYNKVAKCQVIVFYVYIQFFFPKNCNCDNVGKHKVSNAVK